MKHKKRTFFILLVLFIIVLILLAGGIAAVITVPGPIPTPTLEPRDAAATARPNRTSMDQILLATGQMEDFLSEGLDAAGEGSIGLDDCLMMNGTLNNFSTSIRDDWKQTVESSSQGIKGELSFQMNNGIFTYKQIISSMENSEEIQSESIETYDIENRIFIEQNSESTTPSKHYNQIYLDEKGNLYYLFCQLYQESSMYVEMLYYDHSKVCVATKWLAGVTELEVMRYFYQQKPTSFNDLLVVDSYDMYFTYDGTNVVINGDYYVETQETTPPQAASQIPTTDRELTDEQKKALLGIDDENETMKLSDVDYLLYSDQVGVKKIAFIYKLTNNSQYAYIDLFTGNLLFLLDSNKISETGEFDPADVVPYNEGLFGAIFIKSSVLINAFFDLPDYGIKLDYMLDTFRIGTDGTLDSQSPYPKSVYADLYIHYIPSGLRVNASDFTAGKRIPFPEH